MRRQIYIIVPSVQHESSGPSYSVVSFVNSLNTFGKEVYFLSLGDTRSSIELGNRKVETFPSSKYIAKFGFSWTLLKYFFNISQSNETIVHVHSLWMFPVILPYFFKKSKNFKLIVSPRGSLSPWALKHGSYFKKIIWCLVQSKLIKSADLIHVTSLLEYREIRNLGYKNPIALIPNGVDLPIFTRTKSQDFSSVKQVLFLGRLHKKKGLDILLLAWKNISLIYNDWVLKIVGPDDGYLQDIKILICKHAITNVLLSGEFRGNEKFDAYRNSDIFVLPTYSENFGMTVAEALACETPVIVTKGAPWANVEVKKCGLWVDTSVKGIEDGLLYLMGLTDAERREMGFRGREWMRSDFSWQRQGEKADAMYNWLFNPTGINELILID